MSQTIIAIERSDEPEGGTLVVIPDKVNQEQVKSYLYVVVHGAQADRFSWNRQGDVLELSKYLAFVISQTPGMEQILNGILEARRAGLKMEAKQ